MKHIIINTINHDEQRYDTVGDWIFLPSGDLLIRVSKIITPPNKEGHVISNIEKTKTYEDSEFLVGLHELIEAYLCYRQGITQLDVDKWDMEFLSDSEPGDDPNAPYHAEHKIAEMFERMMCMALGMTWEQHEENLKLCTLPESSNSEKSSETWNEENNPKSNDVT